MSLEDDIRSIAKEGPELDSVLGQIKELNPLNGLTKETAYDFIKQNQVLLSAFDSEVSKSVNTGVENFKNKGMQDIIKERENALRQELNPEESEAAKVGREFKEFKDNVNKEKELATLKDLLSDRAKELEFDPIKARRYSKYGEKAIEELEADATWFKTELDSKLSSEIKNKYSKNQPKRTEINPADLDTRIAEARANGKTDLSLKLQMAKNARSNA